ILRRRGCMLDLDAADQAPTAAAAAIVPANGAETSSAPVAKNGGFLDVSADQIEGDTRAVPTRTTPAATPAWQLARAQPEIYGIGPALRMS
ncbi:MAG: hypothetical protein ACRYHC_10785, partial [Janthinobacterium lividum]